MARLDQIDPKDWNAEKARHLLNRAGFGLTQARVARLASLSPEAAVNELVDYEGTPFEMPEPSFLVEPIARRELMKRYEAEGVSAENIQKRIQNLQQEERRAVEQLKGWWLERMYTTSRPLEEKMTLLWHGHFAVSSQKVKQSWVTYDMNQLLRRFATGNFKALTTAVGQSPAMLDYLDNRKSTKNEPNENWARELMELFTLGKGNYTEQDIKESARAFTGWMCTHKDFVYEPKRHDFGVKTFLGRKGDFDGWNIIDILFEQPALATFISRKLWAFFVSDRPEAETVEALATVFRDGKYELKPVLKAMFLSREFFAPAVMGSQIKSPVQFALQLCEDLGVGELPRRGLAQVCRQLGQDLFYPPNVKGWDGNRAWINANSLLIRYNAPPYIYGAMLKEKKGNEEPMMMMQEETPPTGEAAMVETEMQMQPEKPAGPNAEERLVNWRRTAMSRAREKIKALPTAERRVKMEAFRLAGPAEKLGMLKELGIETPPELFKSDALQIFDGLDFATGTECVAALEKRLLARPLDAVQKAAVLEAVGVDDPEAELTPDLLDPGARRDLVRLISSTPQYQLC